MIPDAVIRLDRDLAGSRRPVRGARNRDADPIVFLSITAREEIISWLIVTCIPTRIVTPMSIRTAQHRANGDFLRPNA